MKKYIYTVMLAIASVTIAQAQRMLPGQKGIEISTGTLSDEHPARNYFVNIGLTVNGKHGNYQLWALEYTHQYYNYKDLRIPQETYTAEGGYSFYLFGTPVKSISINLGITGVVGYETVNRGEQLLYDGAKISYDDEVIYGVGGRISLEAYLSNRFVLFVQGRTKVMWGTPLEKFRPAAGVGLRFNL